MEPSQLAKLPAELRNSIYDFAFNPPQRYYFRQSFIQWIETTEAANSTLGITQTCRQLRAETRALFLANATVHVEWNDIPAYLALFQPNLDIAPKKICISTTYKKNIAVDILPLLRLRLFHPSCEIISNHLYGLGSIGIDHHIMGLFLFLRNDPLWLYDIQTRFSQVFVWLPVTGIGTFVRLVIKDEIKVFFYEPSPYTLSPYKRYKGLASNRDVRWPKNQNDWGNSLHSKLCSLGIEYNLQKLVKSRKRVTPDHK